MNKKLLCVLMLLGACGSPDLSENDKDNVTEVSAPESFVDTDGKVWTRSNKAAFSTYQEMVGEQRNRLYENVTEQYSSGLLTNEEFDKTVNAIEFGSFPIDKTQIDNVDESAQTIEQIAQNLRGVSLHNGYEYISEPDYALAERILSFQLEGNVSNPSDVNETNEVEKAKCCGNDDRFTTSIYNDYARIMLSEVGCTAGMISENVAVIAAHCMYDTETNTWLTVKHTSVDPGSRPWFRRHTSYNDTTPAGYSCVKPTIPSCWVSATSNSSINCDYAVLDFSRALDGSSCVDTTPFDTWNGVSIQSDSTYEAASTWAMGFPAYVNTSGGSINSGLTFMYERLNGTWGYDTIVNGTPYFSPDGGTNVASGIEFRNLLDAQQGDSGRPQLDFITSGNYQVAIHVGNVSDGSYNIDRRISSTVWTFIQDNTPL